MFDGSLPAPAELPGIPDAGLIDAVVGWTRAAAAAHARALAVIAELHRRRLADPVHPDWVCDDTDAAAAELSAALTIGHGRALRLFDVAVLLRDQLPQTGALFAAGQVGQSVIDTIYDRTYLVHDPQAWAALDAELAAAVTRFGAMTTYTLTRTLDAIVDRVDPGAVRRTRGHLRNRDFVVGQPDEKSGTTAVSGRLSNADAALFEQRLDVMARSVCPDDPRTLGQRRADAGGALGAGSFHLACRCDHPDCAAKVDDGRASSIIIHVLADHTAPDTTLDPLIHGDPDNTDHPDDGGSGEEAPADRDGDMPDADAEDEVPADSDSQGIADDPRVDDEVDEASPADEHDGAEPADHTESDTEPEPEPPPAPPARSALRPAAGWVIGGGILPAPLLAELIAHGAHLTPLTTPGPEPEPHYRPSTTLARYVRMRDLTCRQPGCARPALTADIDHTIPWPYGPTHAGNHNTRCGLHHLLKTFWPGWTDTQHPDGTLTVTTPTGHTYTTAPGGTLLFPTWNTTTPAPPARPVPPHAPGRGLRMPTRTRTRAKARHYRIQQERAHNDAHLAERNKPPPI